MHANCAIAAVDSASIAISTRINGLPLVECLLRIRNDGTVRPLLLNLGKPLRLPRRLPERELLQAARARPQSTAASSNTC